MFIKGVGTEFLRSVEKDTIAYEIEQNIYEKMNRHTARNEFRSWENSLEYMYKVLNDSEIPEDSGVIQQAITQELTPIYEEQFSENSFGFRPERGQHDALRQCQKNVNEGYVYVVDSCLTII